MTRFSIDYGIDLGTTNSAIALFHPVRPVIFRNNDGMEYTPSAVWMDKNGGLRVGKLAKQRLEDDEENAFAEFKTRMGSPEVHRFARSGREMTPEDLSAEVLKSLKGDVQRANGETPGAAVITVPAAFMLPQTDATNKAARMAGFEFSPLLQEPVAAAMAYGFQSEKDNVFWLVYDFGGGTFDAALIHVRDGVIQVANHDGDNHLGGKNIDWDIVEQLLIPAVQKQARVSDLRRGNRKRAGAIAKLKSAAEEAKIRLSATESADIVIDYLCADDGGSPVRFEHELRRGDVERIADPYIEASINKCRKVLADQRLDAGSVDKVLLVGGPTMMPFLRDRLADRSKGLGIPLEFGVDPLTVVAAGASVFARTQRLEVVRGRTVRPPQGQFDIELEYKPAGPDAEPLVGGRVITAEGTRLEGYAIEFINITTQPNWRSGKFGLTPEGGFMTNLWAEKGAENVFRIELTDSQGTKVAIAPDRLTYVIMIANTEQPLLHSMGVGMANNAMKFYFNKGESLPARRRDVFRTTSPLRRGQEGDVIRVPILAGQAGRADRNQYVGALEIKADDSRVKRDVPVGSEIEITLEIDRSRVLIVKAFIPILEEEFEDCVDQHFEQPSPERLKVDVSEETARLERLRQQCKAANDAEAEKALYRIDAEQMVKQVSSTLAACADDSNAAANCLTRVLDLRRALDEVEDRIEWPMLVRAAEREIEEERRLINSPSLEATSEEKEDCRTLEAEIRNAMGARDPDLLRRKVSELDSLGHRLCQRHAPYWVARLERFEKGEWKVADPTRATDYLMQGRRAINNGDLEGLRSAVRQLYGLMEFDDPARKEAEGDIIH